MDDLPGDPFVRRIARVASRLRSADADHLDDGVSAVECGEMADELDRCARELSHRETEALRRTTGPSGAISHLPALPATPPGAVAPAERSNVIPFPERPMYRPARGWSHPPEDVS